MHRAPFVAICAVGALLMPTAPAAAESPGSTVSATQAPMAEKLLGSITAPADQALRKRSKAPVTVRLELAQGARLTLLRVNGVDVTKQVKRNGRTVKARLGMNGPLKVGANGVLAEFTRDGRRSFDSSRFTVTRAVNGLLRDAWWMSFLPGLAIVLCVLAVNRVGEGLRVAFEPGRPL